MNEPILAALLQALDDKRGAALVTIITAAGPLAGCVGRRALVQLGQTPLSDLRLGELGQEALEAHILAAAAEALEGKQHRVLDFSAEAGAALRLFVEVQRQPPHLVIVGAGHIAAPLAALGSLCDFKVTVLDDRPQFANRQRFPQADQVLAAPLQATVRAMAADGRLDKDTYIVLVTRGHQHDIECLLEVLDTPLAYIGMIGSQRRVDAVFKLLAAVQGIAPARLARVHAPIGLDIGARTPAEIAVCIIAEIISVLRGRPAPSLSATRRTPRPS